MCLRFLFACDNDNGYMYVCTMHTHTYVVIKRLYAEKKTHFSYYLCIYRQAKVQVCRFSVKNSLILSASPPTPPLSYYHPSLFPNAHNCRIHSVCLHSIFVSQKNTHCLVAAGWLTFRSREQTTLFRLSVYVAGV